MQGDTVRLLQLMNRILETIQQKPDSADRYLPMLARLVGSTGMLSETHVGNWENFVRNVCGLSRRAVVAEMCNGFILQNKLHKRNYVAAIAFADSLLATNPTDRLWILSEASKMSSYLAGADTSTARQLLAAIRERGNRIDSNMIQLFEELIQVETETRHISPSSQGTSAKLSSAVTAAGQRVERRDCKE